MHKLELLAPAGNLEKLKFAIRYGADAVYLGGEGFGLRAGADNFSLDAMREGVEFAHRYGAKVYVTTNAIPHNAELDGLSAYLQALGKIGVDALIVADPGVLTLAQEIVPQIPLHLSTQANAVNWRSVRFWEKQGVQRVILARELAIDEISEINQQTVVELECFVHGAMCISYSGRCLLSSYLTGRDANRGDCAHPCRWNYTLMEEKRPGEQFPVFEDEKGTYIFNSKDLRLIEYIPELVRAGVTSFKIEGRMKSAYYAAVVTRAYRQAIDAYLADPAGWQCDPAWLEELTKVSHRAYTTGFARGKPTAQDQRYETSSYIRNYAFTGVVLEYDSCSQTALVEQRNRMDVGDTIEIFGPRTPSFTQVIGHMEDNEGNSIPAAPHAQQLIRLPVTQPVQPYDLLRKAEK